uniref:Uncharacterized protein n=1 Tax=Aegilops tauschii subsp. strangulata TaxID=200361 RepID=A0A453MZJ3_AEGTS
RSRRTASTNPTPTPPPMAMGPRALLRRHLPARRPSTSSRPEAAPMGRAPPRWWTSGRARGSPPVPFRHLFPQAP